MPAADRRRAGSGYRVHASGGVDAGGPSAGGGGGVASAPGCHRRAAATADYAEIDGFEQTAAEVAAAMNLSPMGASYLVSYAEALDTRLPKDCGPAGRGPN